MIAFSRVIGVCLAFCAAHWLSGELHGRVDLGRFGFRLLVLGCVRLRRRRGRFLAVARYFVYPLLAGKEKRSNICFGGCFLVSSRQLN